MYAIRRTGHAEALAGGAILAEVIHVEEGFDANHVGISDDALVPGAYRTTIEDGDGLFAPGAAVLGTS